eukprot:gene7617-9880_t
MSRSRKPMYTGGFADLNIVAPTDAVEKKQFSGCLPALARFVGPSRPSIPEPNESIQSCNPLKILRRVTVILNDPKHMHILSSNVSSSLKMFDLVAVQPSSEKLLSQCLDKSDVDIITFDLAGRIPFYVKTTHVSMAISKGVYFELIYAPVIQDESMRRNAIANAQNIVRISKGRNIIVSSGTGDAKLLRGPRDVAMLLRMFGLKKDQCISAISTSLNRAVAHGGMRKTTYQGVVAVRRTEDVPYEERVPAVPYMSGAKNYSGSLPIHNRDSTNSDTKTSQPEKNNLTALKKHRSK